VRAEATITEVEGSDVIMIFQPRTVTDVITHAVGVDEGVARRHLALIRPIHEGTGLCACRLLSAAT
jgi:hypothetical protein